MALYSKIGIASRAGKLEKVLADNLSWSDFSTNEAETKQALRRHLEAELCAYSEISLSEYGFHIDHKPKGVPLYSNLRALRGRKAF